MAPPVARGTTRLRATLVAIGIAGIAGPAIVVASSPAVPPPRATPSPPRHSVVPQAALPVVEPVDLVALDPDQARAYNAGVPFSTEPVPPARAFRLQEDAPDLARATDCLAAAVLYEAGDDPVGERAVAQVVVNRLRHPAFPKTVCGVVFEGADRTTGCQFTFTCDGALTRWHPTDAAWARARTIATAALSGKVDRPIGYATHYHTDWVVPYWQSSLDKIARVGTHLFFRWAGWWGTPAAFDRHVLGVEPVVAQLAPLSDAHRTAAALAEADDAAAEAAAVAPDRPVPLATDPSTFLVRLDPTTPPDGYPGLARAACGGRTDCLLLGWTSIKAMPTAVPLTAAQQAALSFSFLRDRAGGTERSLWNCRQFQRADRSQCLRTPTTNPTALVPPMAAQAESVPPPATDPGGVRRQSRGAMVPTAQRRPAVPPAATITPPGTSPAPAPSTSPHPPRSSGAAHPPPA